ncbi:DUF3114 domain-containing protein [Streptococcus sp. H31]|uniref:DUF3114 domain-containing protein n=1 Tax=Streptococcus huangxiaojuni TaxID=3237239 RepID=UPI0034A11895
MSIDMYLGASQMQAASTSATVDQAMAGLDQLDSAISGFLESGSDLKGRTYDSARAHVQAVIQPLKEGTRLYLEAVRESVQRLPEAYQEEVGSEDLRQSELEAQIAQCDAVIKTGQGLLADMQAHPVGQRSQERISAMKDSLSLVQGARQELQDKLDKLLAFNARSLQIFEGLSALEKALETGRSQTKGAWQADSQTFVIPSDLSWARTIDDLQFAKAYQVSRPDGMSEQDYQVYLSTLHDQVKGFEADGWTKKAIQEGYLSALAVGYDSRQDLPLLQQLAAFYEEAHIVGSSLFNRMMTSAYRKDKDGQTKTLDMLYRVLGAEVDANGFLQLTNMKLTATDQTGSYRFTTAMDEALVFDDRFSGLVQGAYPKGLPSKAKAGSADYVRAQQTHQFRYYLDKKNNDALRATYPDEANDLERIKRFNAEHPYSSFVGEKARYHNKYQGSPEDYPQHIEEYGENYKYVSSGSGFHTEFIIDKNGSLVSQWNAYEFDENGNVNSDPNKVYTKEEQLQLVDGNSVNYAEKDGGYHTKLDSDPVSEYDPEVRKKVGKEWKSPNLKKGELDYFDRSKSEKEANEKLKGGI